MNTTTSPATTAARDDIAGIISGVVNGPAAGTALTRTFADALLEAGYTKQPTTAERNDLEVLATSLASHRPLWNEVEDEELRCICGNFVVPNADDAGRRWADHAAAEYFEVQA